MSSGTSENLRITRSDVLCEAGNSYNRQILREVWQAFIDGAGAPQLAGNFFSKNIEVPIQAEQNESQIETDLKSISEILGSSLAFVLAGKTAGIIMRQIGSPARLISFAAHVISNDEFAQQSDGILIGCLIKNGNFHSQRLAELAKENPLAKVKLFSSDSSQIAAQANVQENTIYLNSKLKEHRVAPLLAHELTHIKLTGLAEPNFREIANTLKNLPDKAEQDFLSLRKNIELQAAEAEAIVESDLRKPSGSFASGPTESSEVNDELDVIHMQLFEKDWQAFSKDSTYRPNIDYAINIYGSPWGFGKRKLFTHVFAWSTEMNIGAGRSGMFGKPTDIGGYPKDFEPTKPQFKDWRYKTVEPNPDGTFGSKHLNEAGFIESLNLPVNGLNGGLFCPILNDCYNGLERAFQNLGQKYPGAPAPRLRFTTQELMK